MKKVIVFFILIAVVGISFLILWQSKLPAQNETIEIPSTLIIIAPPDERGDFIEIVGEVGLAGTEPLSYLVIRTADGKVYVIVGKKAKELWQFRYKIVRVKGYLHGEVLGIEKSIEVIDYEVIEEE